MTRKKFYNIELLRFILSALIVYYHILNANIIPYTDGIEIYKTLQRHSQFLGNIVECFLIISGIFLYRSEKNNRKPFLISCLDRLIRLWPVYAFYVIIVFIFYAGNAEEAVFSLSFLHATGISSYEKGIIWYISPFFWTSLFCLAVMRICQKKRYILIFAMIAYFGYCTNLNNFNRGLGRSVLYGFLSMAVVRCAAGISMGILLMAVIEEWEKLFMKKEAYISVLIGTLAELLVLAAFFGILFTDVQNGLWKNRFIVVIVFSTLIGLFLTKPGYITRILDHPFFGNLGKYSYSIYVMQQISFNILKKILWHDQVMVTKLPTAVMIISLLFSVLVGVGVYYLIEKPASTIWKKYKNGHLLTEGK